MKYLSVCCLALVALWLVSATSVSAQGASAACTWDCDRSAEGCQAHCPHSPYPDCSQQCSSSRQRCLASCASAAQSSYPPIQSTPEKPTPPPMTAAQKSIEAQLAASRELTKKRKAEEAAEAKKKAEAGKWSNPLYAKKAAPVPAVKSAGAPAPSAGADEVLVCEVGGPNGPRFQRVAAGSRAAKGACHYVPAKQVQKAGLRLPAKKTGEEALKPSTEPLFQSKKLGALNGFIQDRRAKRAEKAAAKKAAKQTGAKEKAQGGKQAGSATKGGQSGIKGKTWAPKNGLVPSAGAKGKGKKAAPKKTNKRAANAPKSNAKKTNVRKASGAKKPRAKKQRSAKKAAGGKRAQKAKQTQKAKKFF